MSSQSATDTSRERAGSHITLKAVEKPNPKHVLLASVLIAIFLILLGGVLYSRTQSRSAFVLPVVGAVACIIYLYWMYRSQKSVSNDIEIFWLAAIIVLGLSYCFLIPAFCVPDEFYHYDQTYFYSDLLLHPFDTDELQIRRCDLRLLDTDVDDTLAEYSDYEDAFSQPLFVSEYDAEEVPMPEHIIRVSGGTFDFIRDRPQVRIPAALGIAIGRIAHLNAYVTFYLGRVFALAYYAVLIFFAIRIIPIGKNVLAASSLLPMALSLGASYSYDSGTIGIAFLLFAMCIRAIVVDEPLSRGYRVGIIVLVALLAPEKAIYSVIAFLVLFIPKERFPSSRDARVFKAVTIVVLGAVLAFSQLASVMSMSQSSASTSTSSDSVGTYSISYFLAHPVSTVMLFLRTIDIRLGEYLMTMVTGPLGWLQGSLTVPIPLTYSFLFVLIYASLVSGTDDTVLPTKLRICLILFFLLAAGGAMLSMALAWTSEGSPIIEGVQGRYFLPVLPLLLIGLRSNSISVRGDSSFPLLGTMAFLNVINISYVYADILLT
jgi:uncharacterized membrane protein